MNYAFYGTTLDIESVRSLIEAAISVEMEPRTSDAIGDYYGWRARPIGECEAINVMPNVDGEDELRAPNHPELQTVIDVSYLTQSDRVYEALVAAGAHLVKLRWWTDAT